MFDYVQKVGGCGVGRIDLHCWRLICCVGGRVYLVKQKTESRAETWGA